LQLLWIVAGFLQAGAGVVVGAYGYLGRLPFVPHVEDDITAGLQIEMHGAASFFYFLFATPLGWLALWLFVEGLMRVLSAAMDQPFSTLPIVLARAASKLRPPKKLPDDRVIEREDGFVIDSARDYDWHALSTIELGGAHYAVTREAGHSDDQERPHRYRLTPITPDHVVRTVTRYPPTSGGA
jgi:hypothetical protein